MEIMMIWWTVTTGTTAPANTGGVTSIINSQLNQGGGGGNGGGGITANPNVGTYQKESIGVMPDGSPMFSGYQKTKGPGVIDSIKNTFDDLSGLYQKYSPVGMIGKMIKDRKDFKAAQTKKALEQVAIQKQIKEAEAAAARAGLGTARGGGAGDSSRGHMGGISQSQADAVGKANKDAGMSGWGLRDGGLIRSYFKGGLVSLRKAYDSGGSVEDYGDLIDAFEKGIDVMPGETLTQYINRIRAAEKR